MLKSHRVDMLTGTSDDDSMNDNMSVISNVSEHTVLDDGGNFGDEVEDGAVSNGDGFEDKLNQALDGLTQKSLQGRIHCLDALNTAFSRKCIPDFVLERRTTIRDAIERSLKKGRGEEQSVAAQLATSFCCQLGTGEITDQICRDLNPLLSFIINDASILYKTRAKCCWALAVLSFIGDTDDVHDTMRAFERIFAASYRKGDLTLPTVTAEAAYLHSYALSAWTLLLTVTNVKNNSDIPSISQLSHLLDSTHLDVRMSAGEAIALLLEQTKCGPGSSYVDDDEHDEFHSLISNELIDKLRSLATDSHKYRAKKDRKTQRSSFRDILRYVENDEPPNIQIRFGQETLALDSWCKKKQYDAFCQVLGSGTNLHLSENELLRDVLELGEKITPLNCAALKQSKIERQLMNAAAFKARCITRGKNRDKRMALLSST